jgi:hypothetical protein
VTDADLVYDGRARKRPPGAGTDVQEIYMLLAVHPEGMTLDEIHAEMRDGWMYTDAYRAYEKHLANDRAYSVTRKPSEKPNRRPRLEYGSPQFKRRAQRWWIRTRLAAMLKDGRGNAKRIEDRYYCGKAPQVAEVTDRLRLVKLDPDVKRAHDHADVQQHVRREELKALMLNDLNGKYPGRSPVRDHLLETIQLAYDYISGR